MKLGSNIHTSVDNQGAGVVRPAIFAMLRYRNIDNNWNNSWDSLPEKWRLIIEDLNR